MSKDMYLDINWYFFDKYLNPISVASAGGVLPNFLTDRLRVNDNTHQGVLNLPENFGVVRNRLLEEYIDLKELEDKEQYYRTFDDLAKRGVYAFDKVNISNSRDQKYILVSYPDLPKKLWILNPERDYWILQYSKFINKMPHFDLMLIKYKNLLEPDESILKPIKIVSILNKSKRWILV